MEAAVPQAVRVVPSICWPEALPVVQRREDIAAAIREHPVVIIAGETGSGKTTQLPKICLELGRGQGGRIGHTQPRRLAARTVAQRIAEELQVPVGGLVGYQVRFNESVSEATAVKLMTDGILLAEIQRDRLLRQYDTLIIDEAHERSLNIDFLLGYLKQLLPQRPDLKLIITSATIDLDSFSRHFDSAPVLEVSGRGYPVETLYLDPAEDRDQGLQQQVVQLVESIEAGDLGPRGDILIFLPGERDIRELAHVLRDRERLDVLPLYARLSQTEQNRVFNTGRRHGLRVVLATNVAETSLTVPGIRYVIDPGEARISRYSARTKLQRLPIEPISRASADQRRGRCGRIGPGVCLRLYSEADYLSRPAFTDPEILRTNLAAVILQMLQLRLGEVQHFPFINPPDPRMVRDGYRLLEELAAVDHSGKLTALGRQMAHLPVDPRLGRMVLASYPLNCLEEMLVIAAALAVQDPRERPADRQQLADQMHARFRHPQSDFISWLNLWRYYEEQRQALSQNQLRKLCQREFLSFLRLREWRDLHAQLRIACRQLGLRSRAEIAAAAEEPFEAIHRALLSGLLSNIAQHQEGREYLGVRNRKLQIFPGSCLGRKTPKWIVAAEVVETSQVFARGVGRIEATWALETNPALLKYHHYEPRWDPRRGRTMAWERVSLFGLVLADRRPVHYGPMAPEEARERLIREGLIAGRFPRPPGFLKHNLRQVRELEELETRVRRRDLLVDEEVLFRFYDEHLPDRITTADRLRSWLKDDTAAEQQLRIPRELLLARNPEVGLEAQFPNHLRCGDLELRLSYQFEPGGETDGVSVTVPVGLLNRVPRHRFEWLVPGLLREKCIQLVKGLPKERRKALVPVPDSVDRVLAELEPDNVPLCQALVERLSRQAGQYLEAGHFAPEKLEDFYRMNIRVVDAKGRLIAQGRDLQALVSRFAEDTRESIAEGGRDSPAREGITHWDFGALPREWRSRQAGMEILAWPALEDRGESVAITLCDYPGQAHLKHRLGLLRLVQLQQRQQHRFLLKRLLRGNRAQLLVAAAGLQSDALITDLVDASYMQALDLHGEGARVRDDKAFQALLQGCGRVVELASEREHQVLKALESLADARQWLQRNRDKSPTESLRDIDTQIQRLWGDHALRDTPGEWLAQYPRYMKALQHRAERLAGQVERDRERTEQLARLREALDAAVARYPGLLVLCPDATEYYWMLEEFRVSLFAQPLGTRRPVSEKRLRQQWQAVSDWIVRHPT